MHKYFRAVGFSEPMKARDTYNLIDDVLEKAEHRSYITDPSDEDAMLAELRIDYGNGYGICAVGVFDLSVGTTLIFRLINSVEFLKYGAPQMERIPGTSVCLSGLCINGTVMLPILKTEEEIEDSREKEMARRNLMNMARSGDEDAMKNLTMQDMDMYAVIMDKLQEDDIYTIVDSTFMPTGVECDLYSVLGEIDKCLITENPITKEKIWILTVMCGDLLFKVCINDKDLFGEPAPGRRFKGVVWMQGIINFPDDSLTFEDL